MSRSRAWRREQATHYSPESHKESVWIPIDSILVSDTQRKKVNRKKVEKHRRDFEEGREVVPIDVIRIDSTKSAQPQYRILGNGRHRYFGAIEAGSSFIPVIIHDSRIDSFDDGIKNAPEDLGGQQAA